MEPTTFTYCEAYNLKIKVDVYKPLDPSLSRGFSVIFFHGGAFMSGDRTDCCEVLVQRFCEMGFLFLSLDYLLLPEVTFSQSLETLQHLKVWLDEILSKFHRFDKNNIVVAGSSSGFITAYNATKDWQPPPKVLLSLSGLSGILQLKPVKRHAHLVSKFTFDEVSKGLSENPICEYPPSITAADRERPRNLYIHRLLACGTVSELLLDTQQRRLGSKGDPLVAGTADKEAVSKIDPIYDSNIPFVFQILGEKDDIVISKWGEEWHKELKAKGVDSECTIVPNKGHAFENDKKEITTEIAEKCFEPMIHRMIALMGG